MAGYSGTPLEQKLGIKDGVTVFLDRAPDGFSLGGLTVTRLPKQVALTLSFHTTEQSLAKRFPVLVERTTQAGMIWVCWPKKAARKLGYETDLDENVVRRIGLGTGMIDVKVCAVDEVWSGLKFVRRLSSRVSERAT